MKYSISLKFKYLPMKMNWEKLISHWQKLNFEPIENYMHTTEYLALGKALPAKLYFKVKVYTNLLSVHYLLCLLNNFVWIFFISYLCWTLNKLFLCCFLDDLVRLQFFLNASIYTTINDEKEDNINSSSISKGFY